MTRLLHVLFACVCLLRAGAVEPVSGGANVFDLTGRPVDPLAAPKAKALVFLFVSVDCPISNAYAPEFRRLREEFGPQGMAFKLVYPIPDQTEKEIREHLIAYDLVFEVFRDPRHSLVKLAQARVTPEAAVFVPEKGWMYRGRIDDRNVDFGKKRAAATTHDLRDALQAILDGRQISSPVTRAVGCYISNHP